MESRQIEIQPIRPFNFDGTVYVPHYFPTPDYEWRPNIMWKTLNLDRKLFGLKMENMGVTDKPRIKLAIYCKARIDNEETEKVLRELDWRFGFNEDISEFLRDFKDDEFLKPVFKRWRGMRANCDSSLYELLIISIVLQNATVKRTVQMMNNLFNAYGTELSFNNKELFAYWNPDDLSGVDEKS